MVTPEYISSLVNFYSNSLRPDWEYDPSATDMRNLQVLGSARAFNLLEKEKIALLADEVGMGKTIQALAVCAALWNQKPNARVLILAPRDEIAKNWEREYLTFISHHYRDSDNVVKSILGNNPIRKMIYCSNLYSLVHQVKQGWGQLFIGKISSFSSLMAGNKSIERLEKLNIKRLSKVKDLSIRSSKKTEYNNEIMQLLKDEITKAADDSIPYFDLVIIDEAHYLRNKASDSLRVNSAKIFFGDPESASYLPVSKKILLLTATPNHSSSEDIRNIISYFSNKYNEWGYRDILDSLCIRRLRRLSKKALNKYNYRNEVASPSDFKDDPLSEMFFGLYQHELAKEIHSNQKEKRGNTGVSGIMKYLEGVEFLTKEEVTENTLQGESNDENNGNNVDYEKGSDARMLNALSRKFYDIFNTDPAHPKYEKLVDDLTKKQSGEKAVVFVRRIPSVKEISKRVIESYDKNYWSILQNNRLEKLNYKDLNRRNFNKAIAYSGSDMVSINEGNDDGELINNNIPSATVLNLFKIVKKDSIIHTAASNFRLRFSHSKPGIFSMFFSPGENYFDKPYDELKSYRYHTGSELLENYYNSALIHRTDSLNDKGVAKDILSKLLNKNPAQKDPDIKKETIPTLLTIFWEVLMADENLSEELKIQTIHTYQSQFSTSEKEAFSNYLEKATLLASEAVVIFFNEFFQLQGFEAEKPLALYLNFCERVKNILPQLKLYRQIIESIHHFKVIYTKVFSINNEVHLLEESWEYFSNAQPVYPYNASNSNQKVLKCFNTPFYPDILVATSVLQEGVNLQYFCNTIYHYGMAWTPGDNEQRIGRVDRMFGKIERLLENNDQSSLNIYYPYLKDTIDEEHLGRFAKRKHREESLIDLGRTFKDASEYAIEENEINGWDRFFRKPDQSNIRDPFPVSLDSFSNLKVAKQKTSDREIDHYYYSIIESLKGLGDEKLELFFIENGATKSILADPHLSNNRMQPVVIDLELDNVGTGLSGEAVFCLTMKTPLAAFSQFKKLKGRFYQSKHIQQAYLPGIKLCFDPSQTSGSIWAIYMVNELPLFIRDLHENPLSSEEIQQAFLNLIKCADLTEQEIFEKDLRKEELNLPLNRSEKNESNAFRKATKQQFDHQWKERGEYLFLEENFDTDMMIDIDRKSFIENGQNRYVKIVRDNSEKTFKYQVAYLKHDASKVELELLKKHLDVVMGDRIWR